MAAGGHSKGSRAAPAESDDEPDRPTKKRKGRSGRKANAAANKPAKGTPAEPRGSSKGGPPPNLVVLEAADRKNAEGKYLRDAAGMQLCWSYNQGKNCPSPCKNGRAHNCEWCRDDHPSVKCRRAGR